MKDLKEIRCTKCNKLLGRIKGIGEIKCPRCQTINKIKN
ncbi:zinc finger domain-containing protein [Gracilibacillus dipsosauri]|uniref:Com family DNA-binding transcriptional regulator n=1 Tax=Gracilibacillus dipsosauri TaxID=178340 RepID=A0A317KTI1_9BACI|nr:hypothetical protein DLJ74_19370 [Gracilibacillus dipsosauri]